jgi:hypothetical protein
MKRKPMATRNTETDRDAMSQAAQLHAAAVVAVILLLWIAGGAA